MSKPFVFHFSYGAHDTPRVMLVVDLEGVCGLCGYEEIQRFYKGVAFHSLGIPSFKRFVERAPGHLAYECSNCGSAVTPQMCTRGAVAYGFADGAGVVQAHFEVKDGVVDAVGYTVDGGKRLDPQSLPPWTRREPILAQDVDAELGPERVYERCERVFHIKGVWRALAADFVEHGEAVMEQVSGGCWLVLGADEDEIEEMLAQEADAAFLEELDKGMLALVGLEEAPAELPWLKGTGDLLHGNPKQWLQPEVYEALMEGRVKAEVYLSRSAALQALEAAFKLARLEYRVDDSDQGRTWVMDITTPRGVVLEYGVELEQVLRLAAHTALTPGEAARMVAEEAVAKLLGVELDAS